MVVFTVYGNTSPLIKSNLEISSRKFLLLHLVAGVDIGFCYSSLV